LCGAAFGVGAALVARGNQLGIRVALDRIAPLMAFLAPLAGGVATVLMGLALVPAGLRDPTPNGAAWVRGSVRWCCLGLLVGALLGAGSYVFNRILPYPVASAGLDTMDRMEFRPGWSQFSLAFAGLFLCPAAEEILFRGLLYGGYRKSFGRAVSAFISTSAFVATHLPDVTHLAPAISITTFAVLALCLRLRSRAIGPAVAAHVGYNAVATAIMYLGG
jgi:membrane protease YdiL (CAAX protease family)